MTWSIHDTNSVTSYVKRRCHIRLCVFLVEDYEKWWKLLVFCLLCLLLLCLLLLCPVCFWARCYMYGLVDWVSMVLHLLIVSSHREFGLVLMCRARSSMCFGNHDTLSFTRYLYNYFITTFVIICFSFFLLIKNNKERKMETEWKKNNASIKEIFIQKL